MKKNILFISVIVLAGISLLYLLQQLVASGSHNTFKTIKREVYPHSNIITTNFELSKDTYFLKIKHSDIQNQQHEIFFNGKLIIPQFPLRVKNGNCENCIYIPSESVKQGTNTLTISYKGVLPSSAAIKLTNYRKDLGKVYIFFADSPLLRADLGHKVVDYINILIFFIASVAFIKMSPFGKKMKYLLLLVWFGLLLCAIMILSLPYFGYKLAITPIFFWNIVVSLLIVLFILAVYSTKNNRQRVLILSQAAFEERGFSVPAGAGILLVIAAINLWVYWPSFSHIFRHDEWGLFFSSRNYPPDFQFVIKHLDWQLQLPYDRLVFRPIHHGLLAVNRVVFDTNYIGPHIVTFIIHIVASGCLLWLLCQFGFRLIAGIFVLLFSVLMTSIDPVVLPHFHAYILATILMLLSIIIFTKTLRDQISPLKGFGLVSLLIFLNMLTTEIAFLMPFCFFASYWLFYRNSEEASMKQKSKAIWLVLLAPMILWSILFSMHIYFAYPDLKMTYQSTMIPLWKALINIAQHF